MSETGMAETGKGESGKGETGFRFEDGAGYEDFMGVWSRSAGEVFVDWLKPRAGLAWLDVGCGNGASTATFVDLCAPAAITGVDPSEAQLAYARSRFADGVATFHRGEGGDLPFEAESFDVAVMALVVFFLPDPAKGVAEMARVVRPGGTVATYAWDLLGGGFVLEPVHAELRSLGIEPALPPSAAAARPDNLNALWTGAGLEDIAAREITVTRSFPDFDAFWTTSLKSPTLGRELKGLDAGTADDLRQRVRARLDADPSGRITCTARANAIRGRRPA